MFFEKHLLDQSCTSENPAGAQNPRPIQALSSLPEKYGDTIDWTKAALNPVFAIQELFTFQASSELQYLNMLEKFISDQIGRAESTQAGADIDSILHFDYTRSILIRHSAHFQSLLGALDTGFKDWKKAGSQPQSDDEDVLSTLKADLDYLSTRIRNVILLCEAGRSTTLSNSSIEETRRSTEEAKLVTELTKATNRLTFIFLPISFVTSAFGMNFKQFGQGPLSIWLWVAIILPLLASCIVLVEIGDFLRSRLVRCVKRSSRKI